MRKFTLIALSLLLMFSLVACNGSVAPPENTAPDISSPDAETTTPPIETPTDPADTPQSDADESDSNILIAYFSSAGNIVTDEDARGNVGHGNTKIIAELIQAQVGGGLFFIETVDKYPANYNDTIDVAMQEQRDNARPELATHVENMDDYGVIFLGFPNWWGTLPQPVFTFLDEYDFSGKTVIPFCTHEGSGFGRSIGDLESTLPDATLLNGFDVRGSRAGNADDDVTQWLADLNLPE